MHSPLTRPISAPSGSVPTSSTVPEAQARALIRRHSLDEQQRAYQGTPPAPHLLRKRPPS